MLRTLIQIILTVAIIATGYYYGKHLINTSPKTERHTREKKVPVVEIIEAVPQTYQVKLLTRGTVSPRTESTLIPQVAGQVIRISDNFRAGRFFEQGEELLAIDPIDYELALTSAKAELARTRLTLSEENAQAQQAKSDWQKLGIAGKPDALVLRKPQLANARASLASADAQVKRAKVNLARTKMIAPYAGRILKQQVDIGQYVSSGTVLAQIYSTDSVEIRLPLTDQQQAFIELPENYRGEQTSSAGPVVTLTSERGGESFQWQGQVVRTEGAIDTSSRQLFVIAQVNDPYRKDASGRPPLKIGQFVQAEIQGLTLEQVYVLPRSILLDTNKLLVMDAEKKVKRHTVEILWQDKQNFVTRSALTTGDKIITTNIPYAIDGTEVRLTTDKKTEQPQEEKTHD